jgi:hypothetical protein
MDDDFSYDDDSGGNTGLYIVLFCIICSLCISSSSSGMWYNEVQNLSDPNPDSKIVCKSYTPFPYNSAVNDCPYNGRACEKHTENTMLCPLNIALVNDDPPGSRSKILGLMTSFSASGQDIFNGMYFNPTDFRTPIFLFGTEDLTGLQDSERDFNTSGFKPNNNRYIKIISDANLIGLSKSTEKDNTTSYYVYVVYDLVITLTKCISLPADNEDAIIVNSLGDFYKALDFVRNCFTTTLDIEKEIQSNPDGNNINNFSCENVSLYVRTGGSKGVKREKDDKIISAYGEGLCFFHDYSNNKIENICSILLIIIKAIDVQIMQQYFNIIKIKNTMTAFEYFMYITLNNYLNYNNRFKYIFSKNPVKK